LSEQCIARRRNGSKYRFTAFADGRDAALAIIDHPDRGAIE
jgi:hypothetical protein